MSRSLQFAREFLRDRRQIGAVVPSGRPLTTMMVRGLGPLQPGQSLVELGPGTGVLTGRLQEAWPDARLLAIEFLPAFARQLAETFPGVEVIEGDAADLPQHLRARGVELETVGGVVSSLPLLSLPAETRNAIFAAIREVLQPGRPYVQFTYSRKGWDRFMPAGFALKRTRRVWRNIPPAIVLTFVRSE